MSLIVEVTHVEIIVSKIQWKAQRLRKVPFKRIDRPEKPPSDFDFCGGELLEPRWTSMKAQVKCHANDEATDPGSSI
jgi:hypothetical protein